jgi:glucose-6-phosphate dehydrogenase assembly protein OpcA
VIREAVKASVMASTTSRLKAGGWWVVFTLIPAIPTVVWWDLMGCNHYKWWFSGELPSGYLT